MPSLTVHFRRGLTLSLSHSLSLSVFTQKNEARRFIWLIDAVYECKSKLFCSSHRGVEQLFNRRDAVEDGDGGGGSGDDFMFKGTVRMCPLSEAVE